MISGLLRIALALIVVLHHLSRFGVGKACVYVFFVLSGYWVARMWNEKYSSCERPWRTFVLARFLRIWPLFMLTNIAAMLMFDWIGRPVPSACVPGAAIDCVRSLVGNSFLLGYGLMEGRALGPAWSLDIELQFYLAAPLIILMLGRGRGALVLASLATVAAALLACWYLPDTLPQYLPFFVVGILAATDKIRFGRRTALATALATGLVLLLGVLTQTGREIVLTGANPTSLASYNEAFNVLIAVLAAPGAVYLAGEEGQRKGAALGDIAFVIYIIHWIPVTIVNNYWGSLPALQRTPYVAAAMALTIGLAVGIWKLIDQPLEAWRRSLTRRGAAATPAGREPELRRIGRK